MVTFSKVRVSSKIDEHWHHFQYLVSLHSLQSTVCLWYYKFKLLFPFPFVSFILTCVIQFIWYTIPNTVKSASNYMVRKWKSVTSTLNTTDYAQYMSLTIQTIIQNVFQTGILPAIWLRIFSKILCPSLKSAIQRLNFRWKI